jgi:alanyl-tRNA synthetase
MAKERGLHVDMAGFEEELKKQRERSRKDSKFQTLFEGVEIAIERKPDTDKFIGYTKEEIDTKILNFKSIDERCEVVLEQTPFYAESGGQVGDTGYIEGKDFRIKITDTQLNRNEYTHIGELESGDPTGGYTDKVIARIDAPRRAEIKKNHTATHLLHKALRMVLGEHVHQAGSLVAPDRLRFDFTHFKAMTRQEIERVEKLVLEKISEDLPVRWEYKSLDEAKKMGAMALFGEKYGETVRVVKTGEPSEEFSLELCGGTHVDHTGEIGEFFITQETAIAAGMRRIEAISGKGARQFFDEQSGIVSQIRNYLKKDVDRLTENDLSNFKALVADAHRRILHREGLIEPIEEFQRGFEKRLRKAEREAQGKLAESATELPPRAEIAAGKILVFAVPADDARNLMVFSDTFRTQYPDVSILTISEKNGAFALTSGNGAQNQEIFKEIVAISGARGGGAQTIRGNMPVDKIDAVVEGLKRKFG